ncbi:metal-dependent hydrolase [Cellulophaga phage phi13:2]|uniref:Metallo-beta-lactamase domain-containing protein n=1 Tax=Cellulophaga phage phi13:2 TaxID=1328030 RepID=S0A5H7_9CAUD|nr:metal-dependent hydrolase [Cellulophaga phage phi13:2]AGO49627.1 metallo-beta-lactamase domain-containing protein [Cellulophaga phage phi13:2]
MKLDVIGSGSNGNCYLLTDNDGVMLIVEAGVHPVDVKKAINYNLENVSACIFTHGHQDHCKAINHLAASGVPIYASKGTLEETNMIDHHRSVILEPMKKVKIGPYTVLGFNTIHDTKEPFGFVVHHPESGSICFITDTVYSPFKFANISHWIVEANYCEDIIEEKRKSGSENQFLRDRVLSSHMSFQNLQDMLRANDLSKTRTITLIHLSDRNSNEIEFKRKIEEEFIKETYIADSGLSINLNKYAF